MSVLRERAGYRQLERSLFLFALTAATESTRGVPVIY